MLGEDEFKKDEARYRVGMSMAQMQSDPIYGSLGPPQYEGGALSADGAWEMRVRQLKP